MNNPISPQTVYIIHQEKIQELERQIEFARIAKEQRAMGIGVRDQRPSWVAQASQWVKEKLFARSRAAAQPDAFEEPCAVTPC